MIARARALRAATFARRHASIVVSRPDRLHPAFYLAANTGMRRGEVLGLRWRDVDLDARRLSVHQAVISVAYALQVADVKTGTSRRTIDLDPRTVAALHSWRKRQLEGRLALGEQHEDHGLVFARPEGAPIHPDLFSKTFDRLVARSGLPVIRLHDLRHSHASLLLKSRVPVKVVSERLGHATPAFTMTVYQHVLPGMQAEAATTFADLLFGPE
ncbi:MAG: site-specific integrase [Acidimicrobiales bacterium]